MWLLVKKIKKIEKFFIENLTGLKRSYSGNCLPKKQSRWAHLTHEGINIERHIRKCLGNKTKSIKVFGL